MDPVVHFELPYDDAQRIARFYQSAFGWRTQAFGQAENGYVLATTVQADARPDAPRGGIDGGFFARSADMPGQHPSVVIGVGDQRAAGQARPASS